MDDLIVTIDFSEMGCPVKDGNIYSDVAYAIQECIKDFIDQEGFEPSRKCRESITYNMSKMRITVGIKS